MKKLKSFLPIIFTLVVICCFYYTKQASLKLYPVLMNFVIFMIFFISSFQEETVIQKIAQKLDGDLTDEIIIYTRNLTYIWAVITFINLLISFVTLFMSNKIWALYNGVISYCIIGLTFMIEYPIRVWYKRKVGFKC